MSDSPGTTRPNWPMQSSPWGLQIASQQPTPRHRLTRVERSDHQFPTVTVDSLSAIVLSMGYINGLYQWVDPVVWDELKTSQVGTQLHNPATTIFRRALFPYNAIILLVEHFFMKCAGICKTSRLHENRHLMTILPSNRWRLATSTSCHSLQVKALVCAPGLASTNLQVWTFVKNSGARPKKHRMVPLFDS